jgi:hypothetical protein
MSELDDLRDAVRRENRRAGRKLAAIAKGTYGLRGPLAYMRGKVSGVDLRGTGRDPRVPGRRVGRMTTAQARAALERLIEFNNSKSIGFYGGVGGAPISRRHMAAYVYETRRYNEERAEYRERTAEVPTPWSGFGRTAEEVLSWTRPSPWQASKNPFEDHFDRKLPLPQQIVSDEAAKKLADHLAEARSPRGYAKRAALVRENIRDMVARTGDKDLLELIEGMDDETLMFVWTVDGALARNISFRYEAVKYLESPHPRTSEEKLKSRTENFLMGMEDSRAELDQYLKELSGVRVPPAQSPQKRSSGRSGRRGLRNGRGRRR